MSTRGNIVMSEQVAPDINIPLSLIRGLRQGMSSTGSGNNSGDSDNCGSLSIGNNSFGFNFDSDEMNKIGGVSGITSVSGASGKDDSDKNSEESVDALSSSDRRKNSKHRRSLKSYSSRKAEGGTRGSDSTSSSSKNREDYTAAQKELSEKGGGQMLNREGDGDFEEEEIPRSVPSSCTVESAKRVSAGNSDPNSSRFPQERDDESSNAVNATVAVTSSSSSSSKTPDTKLDLAVERNDHSRKVVPLKVDVTTSRELGTGKRKFTEESEQGSEAGYNSDDEACSSSLQVSSTSCSNAVPLEVASSSTTAGGARTGAIAESEKVCALIGEHSRKSKRMDDPKREERNAREKDRSFRISLQIDELRNLLSSGGVIVPKGTKSSVLTEAANYIRMLQQHQYRSEIDRQQLVQQIQMIGSGSLGPHAANAVRHAAAKNGVWCLGNFGGMPPQSALTYPQEATSKNAITGVSGSSQDVRQVKQVEEHEYRHIFNSCSIAMAIASMGGAFIDCNKLFCQLSGYSKQELCSMTIFNLTARSDLQSAFDRISSMISPPTDAGPTHKNPSPIVLGGAMKYQEALGITVSLVRGSDGVLKCFCVTLVKSPPENRGERPKFATIELLGSNVEIPLEQEKKHVSATVATPTYTAG